MTHNKFQKPLLFIVGLQKSGTTLLNRLISDVHGVTDPFKPEGRYFWGDFPPFSPDHPPCGEVYQNYAGSHGHHLSNTDFKLHHQKLLTDKINNIEEPYKLILNKNPYNSVRIKWLKEMFPESQIVAIVRDPLANVFSLLKKFKPHEKMGIPPENGWWGVKPQNWQRLLNRDLIKQLSNQWYYVNKEIYNNKGLLSAMLDYRQLCSQPKKVLEHLLSKHDIKPDFKDLNINHQDYEYKTGSRLLSKNKEYLTSGFKLNMSDQPIELEPLNNHEIEKINIICKKLWLDILQHSWN